MKRRLIPSTTMILAVAALIACVTVNVYFPAAEIKDLSRKIEEEVQKQAERNKSDGAAQDPQKQTPPDQIPPDQVPPDQAPPETSTPPGETSRSGEGQRIEASSAIAVAAVAPRAGAATEPMGIVDVLLGVTPAYAQSGKVAAPDVTSPAIRKIIESRAARVDALNKYKRSGVIGENNKGLVEILKLEALTDLKDRADAQRLVKAENSDREELYREIAVVKKVDPAQISKIRETYAGTLRELAQAGDWIQTPDGSWKQK